MVDSYRFNVAEIPWDKGTSVPYGPAINAGVPQMRCFINNKCPFSNFPKIEDVLIFNDITLPDGLKEKFPNYFSKIMATTPGVEGLHFKSRYNYRHNYLFNQDGTEIFIGGGGGFAVNDALYKNHQSWTIEESVFDHHMRTQAAVNGNVEPACQFNARWVYSNTKADSSFSLIDISWDYPQFITEEYEGSDGTVFDDTVQTLRQQSARNCNGDGVHWRLSKKTSLYEGEDFFIEFYRYSKDKSASSTASGKSGIPFGLGIYDALDVNSDESQEQEEYDTDAPDPLDLFNQEYYVVELGNGDPDFNYFIILAERSDPICVSMRNNGVRASARIISQNKKISAKSLLASEKFRMTVRNHLGKLVIEFSGKGINYDPWIIEDRLNENPVVKVPNGRMTIWGGNLLGGFCFSPLTYHYYPIREVLKYRTSGGRTRRSVSETLGITFEYPPDTSSDPNVVVADPDEITPLPNFIQLKAGVRQYLKLTASDSEIEELIKNVNVPRYSIREREELFTQDSQFFKEYLNSNITPINRGWFFYQNPLKEVGNMGSNWTDNSFIEITKGRGGVDAINQDDYFKIIVYMRVGHHDFGDGWKLMTCKTPVMSSIRLISEEGNAVRWDDGTTIVEGSRPGPIGGEAYYLDASDHVMHYSDSWSMSTFNEIEHTGTVKFLLNENINVPHNVSAQLLSLRNKAFYIEMWAGYDNCNYTLLPGFYKLFTGVCFGGQTEILQGRKFLTCKIFDYTKILKDQRLFNSPFFDGVRDVNAVLEIMKIAGFRYKGLFDPGYLTNLMANSSFSVSQNQQVHVDGRSFRVQPYALPSEYARLNQPAFKFQEGDTLYSAIQKIAERAGKLFYFDQHGIAHYEDYLDVVVRAAQGVEEFDLLWAFTSNAELYPGQVIYNKAEFSYDVESVHNHLKIMSNTPDMTPIFRDEMNYNSINNPGTEGFLGYKRTLYQQEPFFGSEQNVNKIIDFYKLMYRPPVVYNFETYGLPMRAGDFVVVDGQSVRVVNVNHTLDPEKNEWWMQVECERFQPINQAV